VELIDHWMRVFAAEASFRAVLVEGDDGSLLAGLPLLEMTLPGGLRVGTLPGNHVSAGGALMLEPGSRRETTAELLLDSLSQLPWPALWLRATPFEDRARCAFRRACSRRRRRCFTHRSHDVGVIRFSGTWAEYQQALRGNHRRHMRKAERRANREGHLELLVERPEDPTEVEALLRRGFKIEDSGWKGQAGVSVIRTPGMLDFFLEQARQLAALKQLQLVYLLLDGVCISFEYG
jgi:hypothetical protein